MNPNPEFLALVVDDEATHREVLARVLGKHVPRVLAAASGEEALEIMARREPDLVFLDVKMPGMTGIQTLEEMRRRGHSSRVIMVTAFAEVEDAVRAMKLGASDYLKKPLDLAWVEDLVASYLGTGRGREEEESLPLQLPEGMVVESPRTRQVLREAVAAAETEASILLTGESGTGKEVIAGLIHSSSPRREGPFVGINLAAFPEGLVESELFGHEKGAFTGAGGRRVGHMEAASGGTLFLDEVGELPQAFQPKLLRVLETRRAFRVGGKEEIRLDFRLVSATNRNLEKEVEEGRFRMDLYYRIAVIEIEIPPLRERREEILPMAKRFADSFSRRPKAFSQTTVSRLLSYDWPGNVRELKNCIQRACILSPGDWILPEHLPPRVSKASPGGSSFAEGRPVRPLDEVEKEAILEAVRKCGGNKSRAARELGISRKKLMYKLKEYGFE